MLYIPKIDDYLKILTDDEVKDFAAINLREKDQNLRKFAKLLYIFLTTHDKVETYVHSNSSDDCIHCYNIEILNLFHPELQLINIKPVIKNNLKKLLRELS